MPVEIKLRFVDALFKKKEFVKSWSGLEELITRTSLNHRHFYKKKNKNGVYVDSDKPVTIERRRLKALCVDNDLEVPLRICELIALNRILGPVDALTEQPLLTKIGKNFLHSYTNDQPICAMIGTRFNKNLQSDFISTWDFRAFKNIHRAPDLSQIRINMLEVNYWGGNLEAVKKGEWIERLNSDQNIIAIASPYVCHATEFLLGHIWNIPSAMDDDKHTGPRLPCYLVWPNESDKQRLIYAELNIDKEELRRMKIQYASKIDSEKRAFLIDKTLYISERFGDNHGLIVAQRQPSSGKIFLVICGTYGPITHAMSTYMAKGQLDVILPDYDDTLETQPVLTVVVKVRVAPRDKELTPEPRDDRKWHDSVRLCGKPILWTLAKNRWEKHTVK